MASLVSCLKLQHQACRWAGQPPKCVHAYAQSLIPYKWPRDVSGGNLL